MTNLFQFGDFTLNSGAKSKWKLECDALTDNDIQCLAYLIAKIVGPFSSVEGVPRGGLRLAEALHGYIDGEVGRKPASGIHLIVDDVLTTGGSMERLRSATIDESGGNDNIIGAVIFARGKCPEWIMPLFQMPEGLWVKR